MFTFTRALLCSLMLMMQPLSMAAPPAPRHIVFDIDWTIVAPVYYNPNTAPERTILVQGERYRVLDGLEEMMTDLHRRGVQVSFYSGGEPLRNELLLKSIRPRGLDGKSLHDIAHKILSKPDLLDRFANKKVPDGIRFWERYEKDLSKVTADLSNVILVEDVQEFVPAAQRRNVVWLGRVFRFYEDFQQAHAAQVPGPEAKYYPTSQAEWLLDRDRIKAVHHLLAEALDETDRGTAFLEAVRQKADEPRSMHRQGWFRKFGYSSSAHCFRRLFKTK